MRATVAGLLLCGVGMSASADDGRASNAASIPPELRSLISQVSDAATRKDFVALRAAMITEFVWSFGGDGDADQAIAEWKVHPKLLGHLAAATKAQCGAEGPDYIQCPANAGTGFRAGFRLVDSHWKMAYFVAGD